MCSVASILPLIAVVVVLILRYQPSLGLIVFGNPLYQPGVMGTVAVAMLLSAVGAALGINSAGQRRNEYQKRSWAGFFLGVLVLSLAIITFAAFWMLKWKVR
jgi:hypothetical protein